MLNKHIFIKQFPALRISIIVIKYVYSEVRHIMQNLSQEKIRELLDKKFSDIEFELKANENPDIITGEVIGYLEAFFTMSLINNYEFGRYHRQYSKLKEKILNN